MIQIAIFSLESSYFDTDFPLVMAKTSLGCAKNSSMQEKSCNCKSYNVKKNYTW